MSVLPDLKTQDYATQLNDSAHGRAMSEAAQGFPIGELEAAISAQQQKGRGH